MNAEQSTAHAITPIANDDLDAALRAASEVEESGPSEAVKQRLDLAKRAEERLESEFQRRVREADGEFSLGVHVRLLRDDWTFVALVAEERGISLDDAASDLLVDGIDGERTRRQAEAMEAFQASEAANAA